MQWHTPACLLIQAVSCRVFSRAQAPAFAGLLLSISVLLAGCADLFRQGTDPAGSELAALFEQPYIDPLTRFLEKHGQDASRVDDVMRVRQERYRRCREVAVRYQSRAATASNLYRLERGYRYSCPQMVDSFSARVVQAGMSGQAADGVAEGPDTAQTEHAAAYAASTQKQIDTEAAENCYLLFDIKNYREAQATCLPPAVQGDARSQFNLGFILGTFNDADAALNWIRAAVEQDLPAAQLQLGLMYQSGQGVSRDDREALRWFRQAAEQGLAEAQYRVGMSYYTATGPERDYREARRWFEQAGEQGHADAQARLGEMYALGQGAAVDGASAENWLKRAAKQGVVDAQYRLGVLYDEGDIVSRDETQAYVWLSVAALAGNSEAEALRERVAQSLDSDRLEQSQQRIRRIVERYH